jgi:hypothetical protein
MKLAKLLSAFVCFLSLTSCGLETKPTIQGTFKQCFGIGLSDKSLSSSPLKKPGNNMSIDYSKDPVVGSARVFERNIHGLLTDNALHLSGDTTLTNSRFITSTGDESRATEANHIFNYDPLDAKFRETSLFTNATKMLTWFELLGFDSRNEQIGIGVNAEVNGSVNNAIYLPANEEGEMPTIRIGNGDGTILANLSTDADVVSHDIAHHVIYRNLKSVSDQSLILHEALADFFVMIKNDDPCFARTVCPAGSPIGCAVEAQCLRTADNNLSFNDTQQHSPHVRGQVVSGMLWDLRKNGKITKESLTRIVFDAVQNLESDSIVSDFIDALQTADERNFGGKHSTAIKDAARIRGLI